MNGLRHICALGAALAVVAAAEWMSDAPFRLSWIPEAQAIIGRPLTPVSYAGVARRTTRRTVAVASTTAVVATESAAAASAAQTAAAAPAATTAPADGALPLGTVVSTLHAGCTQTTSGGVEYYKCGADYCKRASNTHETAARAGHAEALVEERS
jgi:hypothetical protein